jgi:nuclear transport factor 2 (NTF2) superfamily protein
MLPTAIHSEGVRMTNIEQTIEKYVASWNERDPAARHRVVAEIWEPDGVYRNASTEFEGHGRIDEAVTAAYDAFTANGYTFKVASIDQNHDAVRYRWEMVPAAGGAPDSIGTHVAMIGPDGRFLSDHQFIDKAPSAT